MDYLRELDVRLEKLVMKRDTSEHDATRYSEDEAAAAAIREQLQMDGWKFFTYTMPEGGHRAVFSRGGLLASHVADAPTLAMATAEAAARAMEAWCGIQKKRDETAH